MNQPNSETLFDLIDGCNENGYYQYVDSGRWRAPDPTATKDEAVRSIIDSKFADFSLFTLGLENTKKWVHDIEAIALSKRLQDNDWQIGLNMAKFLLLPGKKPKEELAELRLFFERMKPFFEANSDRVCDIQITNNRDRLGVVQGALSCRRSRYPDSERDVAKPAGSTMLQDQEFTKGLNAMVESSEALQHFLKKAALSLQKMGPWSWSSLTEDQLYGRHAGPRFIRFMDDRASKRAASPG